MSKRTLSKFLFLAVLAAISTAFLVGLPAVPFHPDEATRFFTSADVEIFLNRPADLYWRADNGTELRQHYRELDGPLTNSILAIGRWAAGLPALPVDWDWTKTWQENQLAGGLPSPDLLLAGRLAIGILYPFSILFLFLAVRQVANDFTAWTAALLLASNALVLLHTRRAMAEGALLFTLTLSIWTLVKAVKRPWLVAIPAALAFCAKQSLAAIGPVGMLAALWPIGNEIPVAGRGKHLRLMRQATLYVVSFVAIVFLLNPFLWSQPFPAAEAALRARQALASAQTGDRPGQALDTPGKKLIGLIGSVYLTPPIFAETANYQADTRAAEEAYLANPLHSLFRSLPAGGLLLMVSLFGFGVGCLRAVRPGNPARRELVLLLVAAVFQTLILLALIPLPWQRYYLPIIPYACLWSAVGIDQLLEPVRRKHNRDKTGQKIQVEI